MEHNEVSEYLAQVGEEQKVQLHLLTHAAPVQVEGSVDGHPFYYRARGAGWSFEVYKDADCDDIQWSTGYSNGVYAEYNKAMAAPLPWSDEHNALLVRLLEEATKDPNAFEFSYRSGEELYDVLTRCIQDYRQYETCKNSLQRAMPHLVSTSKLTRMWILAEPELKDADDLYLDVFYANNSGWGLKTVASKIAVDDGTPFVMLREGIVMIQRGLEPVRDVCEAMRIDAAIRGFKHEEA